MISRLVGDRLARRVIALMLVLKLIVSWWNLKEYDSDWYRNLRRDPRCRIRAGTTELAATSEPIADEAAALRHVVELFRAKYGVEWVSDWYVERGRAPVRLRLER